MDDAALSHQYRDAIAVGDDTFNDGLLAAQLAEVGFDRFNHLIPSTPGSGDGFKAVQREFYIFSSRIPKNVEIALDHGRIDFVKDGLGLSPIPGIGVDQSLE